MVSGGREVADSVLVRDVKEEGARERVGRVACIIKKTPSVERTFA